LARNDDSKSTLWDVWREGTRRLEREGVEEAAADAELLLLHLLGKSKAELLRDFRDPWPGGELDALWEAYLARRAAGEPVQYVTGEQYFYGRRFGVSPAVLIPRPETELLAEAVLKAGDELWPPGEKAAPRVLDVGTGSGALAVTLAAERPAWRVMASDLSADALEVASRNAELHGVSDRIQFVQGSFLEPFFEGPPIDILVSNPPYIVKADLANLQREVRDYEPHLALDGGEDGLDPYRIMAKQLSRLPAVPRIAAFEVGAGQADSVADLLRSAADWSGIRMVTDYAGIRRHVIAVRS
jgi:release factor glutamine methyltransferase